MDPGFLCFEKDPKFEAAARKGGGKGRQYLANFSSPKPDVGDPIPVIYYAIHVTDPKKLEEAQGVDKILTAAREFPGQLGIKHEEHRPINNFRKLEEYQEEPLMGEASDECFGLGVML